MIRTIIPMTLLVSNLRVKIAYLYTKNLAPLVYGQIKLKYSLSKSLVSYFFEFNVINYKIIQTANIFLSLSAFSANKWLNSRAFSCKAKIKCVISPMMSEMIYFNRAKLNLGTDQRVILNSLYSVYIYSFV